MAAAKTTKTVEKQKINRQIVSVLKRRYRITPPKGERPTLETILYAICLENASVNQADRAYDRLHTLFHDLNEVRVSTVRELECVFDGMPEPEWRALRVRSVLQHVFENRFSFDFETLRRKTLELATEQLNKISYLTPFMRAYTLQTILGAHLIPIDDRLCQAAVWLGLADRGITGEQCSDELRSALRKADAPLFCQALRCFATDDSVAGELKPGKKKLEEDVDLASAPERLKALFQRVDDPKAQKESAKKRSTKGASGEKTQAVTAKSSARRKSSEPGKASTRKKSPTAAKAKKKPKTKPKTKGTSRTTKAR